LIIEGMLPLRRFLVLVLESTIMELQLETWDFQRQRCF